METGHMQEEKHKFAITVVHLRAARVLLNWSLDELAAQAGVTPNTIINWESGRHRPTTATRDRIRDAFERQGVEFLNSGQPGVRLACQICCPLQIQIEKFGRTVAKLFWRPFGPAFVRSRSCFSVSPDETLDLKKYGSKHISASCACFIRMFHADAACACFI